MSSLSGQFLDRWLEIKSGYFRFSNDTLHSMYKGGYTIQGSLSYPVHNALAIYGSLGCMHTKGTSLQGEQITSILKVPFDVGLQVRAQMSQRLQSYVSFGPRYFYFRQHNTSTYVPNEIDKKGLGFFINAGCHFIKNERWIMGIFGEYGFERKSFIATATNLYGMQNVQIGGFTFGASIGLVF